MVDKVIPPSGPYVLPKLTLEQALERIDELEELIRAIAEGHAISEMVGLDRYVSGKHEELLNEVLDDDD